MAKKWTPDASYSAYGGDYFEQGNKYGNNMEIAGSSKAPEAPKWYEDGMTRDDMNRRQRQQYQQYQQDKNKYSNTDAFYSNQNPYEYFSRVMGKAGYTPGGTTGFENWLKNEFAQIQQGYDQANQVNNQLNFNDYLATFGGANALGRTLMQRYLSRTPDQQGQTGGSAYGGPSRWSVF
jgi:hypothetical protein